MPNNSTVSVVHYFDTITFNRQHIVVNIFT